MIVLDPRGAAQGARSPRADRPATAIVHDSPDLRLVVFRLAPGQQVAPHTSSSTVLLSVLEGSGFVSDATGERPVTAGAHVAYEPRELHGMRATDSAFVLLATITPRPGSRPAEPETPHIAVGIPLTGKPEAP